MAYCIDCNRSVARECSESEKASCPDYIEAKRERHEEVTNAGHGDLFIKSEPSGQNKPG